MTPAAFILALLLHESPRIHDKPDIEAKWAAEMGVATELDRKVGSAGLLVSPEVDAAILDAMRWYEARMRQYPKDGDCHHVLVKGTQGQFKEVCNAHGPMQVQVGSVKHLIGTHESADAGFIPTAGGPVSLPSSYDLHDPETGVRAGYTALVRWKRLCGGSVTRWLTAYGWGKCPKKVRTFDHESVRRSELVRILLVQRQQLPDGFKFGHEGRKIRDPHDQRLLAWAEKKATEP